MASKKKQPDPAPEDEQVTPTKMKKRIPADQGRLGLSDEALQQMQAALKAPIGGAAIGDALQAMNDAVRAPMTGIMEELAKSSARLAHIRMEDVAELAYKPELIQMPTPPEVVISRALREEIGNLTEITAAMNTQMTAIVAVASELSPALKNYADKAEKSSRSLNWLTAALVALTTVLAIPVIAEFIKALVTFLQSLGS